MAISTFKNKYSLLKWGAKGSKGEHSGRRGSKGEQKEVMVVTSKEIMAWNVIVKTFKCWASVMTSYPNDVRLRLLHWLSGDQQRQQGATVSKGT